VLPITVMYNPRSTTAPRRAEQILRAGMKTDPVNKSNNKSKSIRLPPLPGYSWGPRPAQTHPHVIAVGRPLGPPAPEESTVHVHVHTSNSSTQATCACSRPPQHYQEHRARCDLSTYPLRLKTPRARLLHTLVQTANTGNSDRVVFRNNVNGGGMHESAHWDLA
jgi:hypothetical protein